MHVIALGMLGSTNTIWRNDIENSRLLPIKEFKYSLQEFAVSVWNGKTMILTGGQNDLTGSARKKAVTYDFMIKDNLLKIQTKKIAELEEKRMKHSMVVVRGIVLVFFGFKDVRDHCSETAEYLDLEASQDTFH